MTFDDIKDGLENTDFNINHSYFLVKIHAKNLINSYYLQEILKRQIELIELQKGKTGQELESAVESELEKKKKKMKDALNIDLV
ncbi:MAG: hypothetical protein KDC67_17885, partial [Ignavibacteriae bacterium]|nr:hypothetical protein [Ignavibacteriota bacterium]